MTAEVLEVRRRLAAFSDRPTPVSDAETRALRRERMVARIAEVLEEPVSARRHWLHFGWPVAAGALGLAAGAAFAVSHWGMGHSETAALRSVELHGSVLCQQRSGDGWVACARPDEAMGLKTLDQARAELETRAGVRLELGSLATLGLTEIEPARTSTSVTLQQGRLAVRVPHLGAGRAFSVVTPSATVVVHGTAFVVEVAKANDGQARTCVRVTEGTVSVRHADGEQWVSAQGSWGCADSQASAVAAAAPPSEAESPTSSNSPHVTSGSSERSTLGVEARLLQKALGAERRGDFDLAEKTLSSLLSSYPNSVVAPDAREALARVRHRQQERTR
jgi:hypothetical protein